MKKKDESIEHENKKGMTTPQLHGDDGSGKRGETEGGKRLFEATARWRKDPEEHAVTIDTLAGGGKKKK